MNNYIIKNDNLLSPKQCEEIINNFKFKLKKDELNTARNYEYFDIYSDNSYFNVFNNCFDKIFAEYLKLYPEIQYTENKFGILEFRFKRFPPGKNYETWHSEHSIKYPHRILNFMLYLSEHNCGTEFYRDVIINSNCGRGVLFPSYFTHTHKGTLCPDNKDRYIVTGYLTLLNTI